MYDAIIIGAGPAGGQCARELALAGKKILLTERNRSFAVNSYSSGGAPAELLNDYQLPESVVASFWNKINIHSSTEKAHFFNSTYKGLVLDFQKLRTWLAEAAGGCKLGFAYQKHQIEGSEILVHFKDLATQENIQLKTKVLIDATGSERQVLPRAHAPTLQALGMEWHVEATPEIYQQWEQSLSFFMGRRWMPQGYSWIFPMDKNRLKVGIGRYFVNETYVPHEKSYHFYLQGMMRQCLGSENLPLIDKHGKTLIYSYSHKDPYYFGPVIAIGDAISAINPLGLEGIRHGLASGRIAAKHILNYLENRNASFADYEKEMQSYFGMKWKLCEFLSKIIYRQPQDARIDDIVNVFSSFTFDEIISLAFHYRFKKAFKFLLGYIKMAFIRH